MSAKGRERTVASGWLAEVSRYSSVMLAIVLKTNRRPHVFDATHRAAHARAKRPCSGAAGSRKSHSKRHPRGLLQSCCCDALTISQAPRARRTEQAVSHFGRFEEWPARLYLPAAGGMASDRLPGAERTMRSPARFGSGGFALAVVPFWVGSSRPHRHPHRIAFAEVS